MLQFNSPYSAILRETVAKATIQLFDYSAQKMKGDGSVIYLRTKRNSYLISAAHNLDNLQFNYGIQLNKEYLRPLKSSYYISGGKLMSQQERDKDGLDIGVLILTPEYEAKLSENYEPLTLKNIEISFSDSNSHFIVFGYPGTKKFTRVIQNRLPIGNPFIYHTQEAELDNYDLLGYSRKNSIILAIETVKTAKPSKEDPIVLRTMKGLSGSGIWIAKKVQRAGKTSYMPKLVGIIHFHHVDRKTKKEFVVGTRIGYITEVLRSQLGERIKKTKILTFEDINSCFN